MEDRDETSDHESSSHEVPFQAPFKNGRGPMPCSSTSSSSTEIGDEAPLAAAVEAQKVREEIRDRTRAAARVAGNDDNLTLKVPPRGLVFFSLAEIIYI